MVSRWKSQIMIIFLTAYSQSLKLIIVCFVGKKDMLNTVAEVERFQFDRMEDKVAVRAPWFSNYALYTGCRNVER